MDKDGSAQAEQLHRAVNRLVKRYQLRDRNDICCYGISVSQCYALEALSEHGALTMQALAEHLHLAVSSVTRVIDQLVSKHLAERHHTARDRRVCCVSLTAQGQQLLQTIHAELVAREQTILEHLPVASRAHVIWAIEALSEAMDERQSICVQTTTTSCEGD
ncbi:MAG: MarR family winged helix-turn-helix transcriptional regulator [Candidatus Tectimicrobiota bacterium]